MGMAVRVVPYHTRQRGCLGKRPYWSLDDAQEALLRVVAQFRSGELHDPAPDHPMSVYHCTTCTAWHIGHQPADPARRA